tara:strand:+ start:238 stop:381 length:144 start_codon:yes stop_codon:yes gene_type:complete
MVATNAKIHKAKDKDSWIKPRKKAINPESRIMPRNMKSKVKRSKDSK